MKASEFPDCCGIIVLSGFGNTMVAHDNTNYSQKEIDDYLSRSEISYKLKAFLIATLNQDQKNKIGEVFEKKGWEMVGDSYHPIHDSQIYIYIKKLNKV